MNLDTLLEQPLAPVRDDGFSVRVLLARRRSEERRRLLLWGAAALALLPPLALLPAPAGAAAARLVQAAGSPFFAYGAGIVVALWAWRPLGLRF